jgi:hypothetical protein
MQEEIRGGEKTNGLPTCEPNTWAQDGSWGYRTPIYMLNQIIRLQAMIEIITNQTASALE